MPEKNNQQIGKSMLTYYWPYKKSVMKALTDEENEKGSPVYFVDILKRWSIQESYLPKVEPLILQGILFDLYRDD